MSPESIQLRHRKAVAGERAQKKLMEAGLDLFGRYSFDGVSTRILADRAKVNLASIQYYFGSKEGLYHAVARHIVEQVGEWLAPALSEIDHVLARDDGHSSERCFFLLCELFDRLITQALGSRESRKWVAIIMREQLEPTAAFEILHRGILMPIHRCFCRLVAGIIGLGPEDRDTQLKVYAMLGQFLIFHVSRAEVDRTLNWRDYGAEEIKAIRRIILDHVRAILEIPYVPPSEDLERENLP
jgi:TetR/AcrR family transcriptional regulator, regulator of cefoperazone and chloramphenicol sensitivity